MSDLNEESPEPGKQPKRTSKACLVCRARKSKCTLLFWSIAILQNDQKLPSKPMQVKMADRTPQGHNRRGAPATMSEMPQREQAMCHRQQQSRRQKGEAVNHSLSAEPGPDSGTTSPISSNVTSTENTL
ncbi:hypothetical protein E4T43_02763 [Aureobasidium subglaciale]|nr:hypothetical protein E4T43_02763 [Aureobasidium subglaciale]